MFKSSPADFEVVERPLYELSGEGEHLYLTLRREGHTTFQVQRDLADLFGLDPVAVGYAGLKDKWARCTQTFSLALRDAPLSEVKERVEAELGFEILGAQRHGNKLRTGHLLGNRFSLWIRGAGEGARQRAEAVLARLGEPGLPNYYGEQRFGRGGDNAATGRAFLLGERRLPPRHRKLMLSALQSQLFNDWLASRICDGLFDQILLGDLAKKEDTGGLFLVEDLESERARFAAGEIGYTGPMWGSKMKGAEGPARERELAALAAARLELDDFARVRMPGSRRRAFLRLGPVEMTEAQDDLRLDFDLPKGSYATTLLAELGVSLA